jgi:hypothetical protein
MGYQKLASEALVHMRVLADDLKTYLNSTGDPLGVLKVVFFGPGQDWKLQIRLDEDTSPELILTVPKGLNPWELLDGTIPELHWSSSIEVCYEAMKYLVQPISGELLSSAQTSETETLIRIKGFCGNTLNHIWGDEESIKNFLKDFSWLGIPVRDQAKGSVTWKYMSKSFAFTLDNFIVSSELGESLAFHDSDYVINIYERPKSKETEIYHRNIGNVTSRSDLMPIVEALKKRGVSGALVILSRGWKFDLGPLGIARLLERVEKVVDGFRIQIMVSNDFDLWLSKRRRRKWESEASRLSYRIEQAKSADRVFYKDQFLGTLPTSEAGASAILHKLEVIGGIPFPIFRTVAWASSDGIDAIADIQFDLAKPVELFLPVEYEFKFENFLNHAHPHEHVRLVVCWFPSALLTKTQKSWICTYKDARFEVLVLSEIPGLTIQKMK